MYAIIFSILISSISLIGLLTLKMSDRNLKRVSLVLVSIAAGTLLGDAFIHLLPKAIELESDISMVFGAVILGILVFFTIESFIHWHHHIGFQKDNYEEAHTHSKPLAVTNLIGDGLHNFTDGVSIAAGFAISFEVGLAITFAIALHEIPQETADFGILIHAGFSRAKALFWNFFSGFISVFGVLFYMTFADQFVKYEGFILAFVGGTFIYISISDLFPEIRKKSSTALGILQLVSVVLGVGLMYLLTFVE